MKYLAILPRVVFPADTGAKIRNLNMFSRLSRGGDEATIVCYRGVKDTDQDVERMRAICTHLELVPWNEAETFSLRSYAHALRNISSRFPYCVEKYATMPFVERVRQLVGRERYDAIVVDTAPMALTVAGLADLPPVLCFQHNVEFVIRQRQYENEQNPLLKAFLYYDYLRMKRFEGEFGSRFNHLIMVSENDCGVMARDLGVTNTSSVPLGVDTEFFSPDAASADEPARNLRDAPTCVDLVFTGSMDWLPNSDGILWFIESVLPLVSKKVATVRLVVVGRRPGKAIERIASQDPRVVVTGWVRDVRPFVKNGRVYVVPLRIGGGTRIKIFEAMSMAMPVVSTSIGAEGLPVSHGENILLADSAQEFADRIVTLIEDPEAAARIGRAARDLVVKHYSWENAAEKFAAICQETVLSSAHSHSAT